MNSSAGVGIGTLECRLFDQKCRYDPVDDLQDRREQLGMCSEVMPSPNQRMHVWCPKIAYGEQRQ